MSKKWLDLLIDELKQADYVLRRHVGPRLDDRADLVTEDLEELDGGRDAAAVLPGGELGQPVDQGDHDVLHVDGGLQLGTGLQETRQAGQVELVRENLELYLQESSL